MARYLGFKAHFFVRPDGVALTRCPPLTQRQKTAVFQRDRFVCRYCGRCVVARHYITAQMLSLGIARAQIDHVIPVSRGGQNDDANLVTACRTCNESKGADRAEPDMAAVLRQIDITNWRFDLNRAES